ncbi:deleted in lung and esophageal cancer protein 1 [Sarcophilus harrisii]|uniref:deleted in lung and esophageal cancer protein 1 n=1 Tax=Sarcophilus harrisii TaxID=9305 RepID=UPI0013020045|nr:deleted in lung and esophageal cancer protein 1 [Sarcophilus harrisii]
MQKLRDDYTQKLADAEMVELHIIQAQARALAEEERVLNNMKAMGSSPIQLPPVKSAFRWCVDNELLKKNNLICPEDYIRDPLPLSHAPKGTEDSVPEYYKMTFSYQQHILEPEENQKVAELVSKKKLPAISSDVSLSTLTKSSTPEVNLPTIVKKYHSPKNKMWMNHLNTAQRVQDRERLRKFENKYNFLKNPRFYPPNTVNGGKSLIFPLKKPELMEDEQNIEFSERNLGDAPVFLAKPAVVFFTDYVVGPVYEIVLDLQNMTSTSRHLRVLPPSTQFFSLGLGKFPGKGGLVAPGMICQYTIRFAPDSLGDFDDFILVETQSIHTLLVPLQARRSPPILTLGPVLNCGYCLVGGIKMTGFVCKNVGLSVGRFCIMPKSSWPPPSFRAVATVGFVEQAPFGILPAVFELFPEQAVLLEVLFLPTSLETVERPFVIVCDNCQIREVIVSGTGQLVALELLYVSGEASYPEAGELTDLTAQHFIRFESQNIQTTNSKHLIIRNATHVALPFHWQIMKPNLLPLMPGEAWSCQDIKCYVDSETAFTISPSKGCLQPHSDHEFILSFAPEQLKDYHSVIQIVLEEVPDPSCLDKERGCEVPSAIDDVIALEIEVKGSVEPFQILLEPYAIIIPGENYIGVNVKKDFKMWNNSKSPIQFTWGKICDCHIVEVEPCTGTIGKGASGHPGAHGHWQGLSVGPRENSRGGPALREPRAHRPRLQGGRGKRQASVGRGRESLLVLQESTLLHAGPTPGSSAGEETSQASSASERRRPAQWRLAGTTCLREEEIKPLRPPPQEMGAGLQPSSDPLEQSCQASLEWWADLGSSPRPQLSDPLSPGQASPFCFEPPRGYLPPLGDTRVTVIFEAKCCQSLQTVLELLVENGEPSYLPVYGEVQRPYVYLKCSQLLLSNMYFGIGTEASISLFNGTLLPTKFYWGKLLGTHSDLCQADVCPPSGILGPNEEKKLTLQFTTSTMEELTDLVLPCQIEGMKKSLVLGISGKAKGLDVTISIPQSSGSSRDLFLDFGSNVPLRYLLKNQLVLTNKSAIEAPFSLEFDYFGVTEEMWEKKPKLPDVPPAMRHTARTMKHLARRDLLDSIDTLLSHNKGAAFFPHISRGMLEGFQKLTIDIAACGNMWGDYHDQLICKARTPSAATSARAGRAPALGPPSAGWNRRAPAAWRPAPWESRGPALEFPGAEWNPRALNNWRPSEKPPPGPVGRSRGSGLGLKLAGLPESLCGNVGAEFTRKHRRAREAPTGPALGLGAPAGFCRGCSGWASLPEALGLADRAGSAAVGHCRPEAGAENRSPLTFLRPLGHGTQNGAASAGGSRAGLPALVLRVPRSWCIPGQTRAPHLFICPLRLEGASLARGEMAVSVPVGFGEWAGGHRGFCPWPVPRPGRHEAGAGAEEQRLVGDLPSTIIQVHMGVVGCPITLFRTSRLADEPPQDQVIRFGTQISGGDTISRTLRLNNTSPYDIRLDWEIYRPEADEDRLVDFLLVYGKAFPLKDEAGVDLDAREEPQSDASFGSSRQSSMSLGTVASPEVLNGTRSESEEEQEPLVLTAEGYPKVISVILRPHDGVLSEEPYSIIPKQLVIPAAGSNFIHVSFTPGVLPGSVSKMVCNSYALGFMSLDSKVVQEIPGKVKRAQNFGADVFRLDLQGLVRPAWLSIEQDYDGGMTFYLQASDLIPANPLLGVHTEIVTTHRLKLNNFSDMAHCFGLLVAPPFSVTGINPEYNRQGWEGEEEEEDELAGDQFVLNPLQNMLIEVSFTLSLELLTYQKLPSDQMLPGVKILQERDGSRRMEFAQDLVLEYSNGTMQVVPLLAVVTIPSLQLSTSWVDFGICVVSETYTREIDLLNLSACRSYWLALIDQQERHKGIFYVYPTSGVLEAREVNYPPTSTNLYIHFTPSDNAEFEAVVMVDGILGEACLLHVYGQGSYDEKY